MKTFDRYIIVSFLRNYVLSFVVLVGLYVALDMVFNFDELMRGASAQNAGGDTPESSLLTALTLTYNIAEFYFYQMFAFFVQLSGIIPVVAAAFTLVRMMRFNELTAMLSAGVPILRIAVPVIVAAAAMSVLLVIDQELIIPSISYKLTRQHDEVGQVRKSSYLVRPLEDDAGSILMATRYQPPDYDRAGRLLPPSMDIVDIIEFNNLSEPVAHIQASSAIYNVKTKAWDLKDGKRQTGLRPQDKITTTSIEQWKTSIGPDEIALYKKSSYVEMLSTKQINALLEHPRNYGTVPLLRVKHWRFVQPLSNIVLLLLAIPCILTREPNAIKQAATRTLLVTAACLATIFVSHQLAGRPPTPGMTWFWPALMLWLPVFIYAPIAVWMLERTKT